MITSMVSKRNVSKYSERGWRINIFFGSKTLNLVYHYYYITDVDKNSDRSSPKGTGTFIPIPIKWTYPSFRDTEKRVTTTNQ